MAGKIALLAIAIGTVTATSASYFMYRGSVDIMFDRAQEALSSSVDIAASRISTRFDSAVRDVLFLADAPSIDDLVRLPGSAADPGAATARENAATVLAALLRARPGYFQARFLDERGREIVRIDRSPAGVITRTAEDDLQDKGDRPYFVAAAKLTVGSVYVSPIDLNQEHGAIEVPHRPTARVATPLFDPDGRFSGILVLNLDLNSLFAVVDQTIGRGSDHFIANSAGDYVFNPDEARTFGFESGRSFRLQEDFPEFLQVVVGGRPNFSGLIQRDGKEYLAFGERVTVDPSTPDGYVVVAALASNETLLARTRQLAVSTAFIALAVIFAAVVFSLLFSRLFVRPILAMTRAASDIAEGRREVDLSRLATRTDETGELARAVTVMVREIGERERRLTEQTQELTRSNQELAQFAYVASHDLQEPLRMVGSYLDLLSRRYEKQLDDEAQEFIGFAVDGATRMKRLINDLLGYSRAGNTPLKLEITDIGEVVARVLQSLALHVEETHAVVNVGKLPRARVDAVQFGRVFQNLIENALKYHSDVPPRIDVAARHVDGAWRFSVADNGIGIDPAFRDKVFEIFKRLHGRDRYPGTGIGLAVSKLVVERHGGRIWVEAGPAGGSIFYFTLPDTRSA